MQLGWVPHGHHGGHHGGGVFPGWYGGGWLPQSTTVYEVQQQDNRPLYFIGGVALIGLLLLSRR